MRQVLQSLKVVLVLTVSIFLLACESLVIQGVDLGKALDIGKKVVTNDEISEKDEASMGAQMAAIILGSASLHENQALQGYVNKVGRWVALQSERPQLQWQFAVLDTNAVNAFAMPGGYILVTSGMLDILSNEAELAAVLAHEVAHVNDKHYLKAMEKAESLSLVTDVASLAGQVYQARENESPSQQLYRNQALADKLINTTTNLYSKGLEREDEFQADSHAVTLLARSGYDPYAMAQVLQKLAIFKVDDAQLQMLFNSHPKPDDRLESIVATYEQLPVQDGQLVEYRFDQVMGQVKRL